MIYHIIFATKDRFPMIASTWEEELYRYLVGIVKNHKGVVIAINGTPDHVHLLVVLQPCDFPAFMRELKASSSKWAKQHNSKFSWQRRYGAFTVSESAVETVRDYIHNVTYWWSEAKPVDHRRVKFRACETRGTGPNIGHVCFTCSVPVC
jgi:REP element-mobilizing transposase RayT